MFPFNPREGDYSLRLESSGRLLFCSFYFYFLDLNHETIC